MQTDFDSIIIGAGMSGLAAAIRLQMFDKKVIIFEQHSIPGGLNSFYQRRIPSTKGINQFDVGLHALTNFAGKGEKGKPLTKLLKQLRLSYDDLSLQEQSYSLIKFKSEELKFSNELELFISEINEKFPQEADHFQKFLQFINSYDELSLNAAYIPSREILKKYFKNPLLIEMILAPLLIYGSAWENDMDFSQFVIMFKSIYLEGFSRPDGGVRTILNLLESKYKDLGGEIKYKANIEKIIHHADYSDIYLSKGEKYTTRKIFSSAGLPETLSLVEETPIDQNLVGNLSFTESIYITKDKSFLNKVDPTIIFYNNSDEYSYQKAEDYFDTRSAVICFPDNYDRLNLLGHGTIRLTNMANFEQFNALDRMNYLAKKKEVSLGAKNILKTLFNDCLPEIIFEDIFSPTTIKRYTKHFDGTVYGSPLKVKNGKTKYKGIYIIGTDQGFLGIVGSMLSGISIANLYGLMESE